MEGENLYNPAKDKELLLRLKIIRQITDYTEGRTTKPPRWVVKIDDKEVAADLVAFFPGDENSPGLIGIIYQPEPEVTATINPSSRVSALVGIETLVFKESDLKEVALMDTFAVPDEIWPELGDICNSLTLEYVDLLDTGGDEKEITQKYYEIEFLGLVLERPGITLDDIREALEGEKEIPGKFNEDLFQEVRKKVSSYIYILTNEKIRDHEKKQKAELEKLTPTQRKLIQDLEQRSRSYRPQVEIEMYGQIIPATVLRRLENGQLLVTWEYIPKEVNLPAETMYRTEVIDIDKVVSYTPTEETTTETDTTMIVGKKVKELLETEVEKINEQMKRLSDHTTVYTREYTAMILTELCAQGQINLNQAEEILTQKIVKFDYQRFYDGYQTAFEIYKKAVSK